MTDTHGEEPIPLSVSVTAGPHSELTLAIAGEVDHVTVDLQVKPSPAVRKLVTIAGLDELLPLVNA